MSMRLDASVADTGTRFRIFPQPRFLDIFDEPEVVIRLRAAGPDPDGPADDRMFVVDASTSCRTASSSARRTGATNRPSKPGPDGHFAHLDPESREFSAATMYATVRRVLDIWEDYFGHRIEWHFESDFARLGADPADRVGQRPVRATDSWSSASGAPRTAAIDHIAPYCENFDVLAHELGHSIIFSQVGVPVEPRATTPSTTAACTSRPATSSPSSARSTSTRWSTSCWTRRRGTSSPSTGWTGWGSCPSSREIRVAFNSMRMSDVGDEPHERSLPLTGGIFDTMVEVFQQTLVERELITEDCAVSGPTNLPGSPRTWKQIQADFAEAYPATRPSSKRPCCRPGTTSAGSWPRPGGTDTRLPDLPRHPPPDDAPTCSSTRRGAGRTRRRSASASPGGRSPPSPARCFSARTALKECGLDATRMAGRATTGLEDGQALEELFRRIVREVTGRDGQKPRTAGPKPAPPGRKAAKPQP